MDERSVATIWYIYFYRTINHIRVWTIHSNIINIVESKLRESIFFRFVLRLPCEFQGYNFLVVVFQWFKAELKEIITM